MKLIVHPTRSASMPIASIQLPRWSLLTLLNVDLTSMNSEPATFFLLQASCVRFIRCYTRNI